MVNTVHTFVGWKIGSTRRFGLALLLAFASHFVFDAIPHLDPIGQDLTGAGRNPLVYSDVFLPWLALWLIYREPPWRNAKRMSVALAACLPDFLCTPALAWHWSWLTDTWAFQAFNAFHRETHFWRKTFPMPAYWLMGAATQAATLVVIAALSPARIPASKQVRPAPQFQI